MSLLAAYMMQTSKLCKVYSVIRKCVSSVNTGLTIVHKCFTMLCQFTTLQLLLDVSILQVLVLLLAYSFGHCWPVHCGNTPLQQTLWVFQKHFMCFRESWPTVAVWVPACAQIEGCATVMNVNATYIQHINIKLYLYCVILSVIYLIIQGPHYHNHFAIHVHAA